MDEIDPRKVRVRDGWCVVLADARKTLLASGIHMPEETGVEKVTEGAGTIIRVGEGKKNWLLGIEVGDRVVVRSYLKYANTIPVGKRWPDGQPMFHYIMSSDDIMGVLAKGVEVGVFSGRPQVPERK